MIGPFNQANLFTDTHLNKRKCCQQEMIFLLSIQQQSSKQEKKKILTVQFNDLIRSSESFLQNATEMKRVLDFFNYKTSISRTNKKCQSKKNQQY
jgi:predicted protein tyrosine phosphatase